MQSLRLIAITLAMTFSFGVHSAMALSVQDGAAKGAAANLGDPDDTIPYPHVADDGGQPSNGFQLQQIGGSGVSMGLAPSSDNYNAFQRAQDRMQQ